MKRALVAGGGGFVGGHLVRRLLAEGYAVRSVDIKPKHQWHQVFDEAEEWQADLSKSCDCHEACHGIAEVFNLAADMGGMGFIENNRVLCMLNVLTNTQLLSAATQHSVERYFFASSACVYNAAKQVVARPLKETDAYPEDAERGYGQEKLFSEWMCRYFADENNIETRIARFHNVYGPHGSYNGGREKAPAAICRKVIEGRQTGEIEIWGDGNQVRSFMYIDDCIEGILRIMRSDVREPLNLGSEESVTINQLVDAVEDIAGVKLNRRYNKDAPKGVNGRSSDNTLIREKLGWSPSIKLRAGLEPTFKWIQEQMA